MATNLQLAKLSDLVYKPGGGTNDGLRTLVGAEWELLYTPRDLGLYFATGYFGVAYYNSTTKEIVIAHRGTEWSDWGDITNNIAAIARNVPDQLADAKVFYSAALAKAEEDDRVILSRSQTGHSLGGGLASVIGAESGDNTVAFNAVGMKSFLASAA